MTEKKKHRRGFALMPAKLVREIASESLDALLAEDK